MFDSLTGKLEQAFKNIKGEGKLTELIMQNRSKRSGGHW